MQPLPSGILACLRQSWRDVEPIAPRVAARFYDNLFTAHPSLVALFEGSREGAMDEQVAKLVLLLTLAVRRLDTPDALVPLLCNLGRHHADHGIEPEHYRLAGEALATTLAQCLGDRFTPPIAAAWAEAYASVIGELMAARVAPMRPAPLPSWIERVLSWLSLIRKQAL